MKTLQFDQNGYLHPYEAIPATVQILEELFVKVFPFSDRRKWLFENYLEFVSAMQRDVFPYFIQWINGSFVTQKQGPKDIDTLTFLDYRVYKAKSDAMELFWSFNLENKGLERFARSRAALSVSVSEKFVVGGDVLGYGGGVICSHNSDFKRYSLLPTLARNS